tara:strand:+ start:3411 stop:11921 length:8511 start_codon:yes stop_codon:yes gene_type:complete
MDYSARTPDEWAELFGQSDNELVKSLWDSSAYYDLRGIRWDTEGDETKPIFETPLDEDTSIDYQTSATGPAKRALNILESGIFDKDKLEEISLYHKPPDWSEQAKYGFVEKTKEMLNEIDPTFTLISHEWGLPRDTFLEEDFDFKIDQLKKKRDAFEVDVKAWQKAGKPSFFGRAYKKQSEELQRLNNFFERLPEITNKEEYKGQKVIRLEEYIPGETKKIKIPLLGEWLHSNKNLTAEDYERARRKELTPAQEEDEKEQDIALKELRGVYDKWDKAKEDDIRFQAYENWTRGNTLNFWEKDFYTDDYWFNRVMGIVPSLLSSGLGAGTGVASQKALSKFIKKVPGKIPKMIGMVTTLGAMTPLEATPHFKEAYLDGIEKFGNTDAGAELARTQAAASTAVYLPIIWATEAWPTSKFMDAALTSSARRAIRKNLHKGIYGKVQKFMLQNPNLAKRGSIHVLEAAKQGGREGLQESLQYVAELGVKMGYKDESFSEMFDWHELSESFTGGMIMGGALRGGVSAVKGKELYKQKQMEFGAAKAEVDQKGKPIYKRTLYPDKDIDIEKKKDVSIKDPSVKNLIDELISPPTKKVLMDRENIDDRDFKNFVKEIDTFSTTGRIFEKTSTILDRKGKEFYDDLPIDKQNRINRLLQGGLESTKEGENIVKTLYNPKKGDKYLPIAEDIIKGKIKVSFAKDVKGKIKSPSDKTRIKVLDSEYSKALLKEYEKDISGLTPTAARNELGKLNLDISKADIESSLVKEIEKEDLTTVSVKDIEESDFKEWSKQQTPSEENIVGKKAAVINDKSKFNNQVGTVVKYDTKKDKIKMEFADGKTAIIPFKQIYFTPEESSQVGVTIPDVAEATVTKKTKDTGLPSIEQNVAKTKKLRARLDTIMTRMAKQTEKGLTVDQKEGFEALNIQDKMLPFALSREGVADALKKEGVWEEFKPFYKESKQEQDNLKQGVISSWGKVVQELEKTDLYIAWIPKKSQIVDTQINEGITEITLQSKSDTGKDVLMLPKNKKIIEKVFKKVFGQDINLKVIKEGETSKKQTSIDEQVDKDFLEQEVSKRLEKAVKGTKGDVPRDVLEKDIRKKLKERDEIAKLFEGEPLDTPKKIDKNKARIAADRKMAEIEQIEGVDIKSVGLPVKGGLERFGNIEIAPNKQNQGLGENWVNSLKVRRKTQGRETIDIIAKPGSEGFWEKQGFKQPFDVNKLFDKEGNLIVKNDKPASLAKVLFYKDKSNVPIKLYELLEQIVDVKSGKVKKVDGEIPIPMVFDLEGVTLQDLVVKAQTTLKDKPISEDLTEVMEEFGVKKEKPTGEDIEELIRARKKREGIDPAVTEEDIEKQQLKSSYSDVKKHTKKGWDEFKDGMSDLLSDETGAIGDLGDEIGYAKAKVHFQKAYDELKKSYKVGLEDFVPSFSKAIKGVSKRMARRIRNWLNRWAREIDPNISDKLNSASKSMNIVELMGFGPRKRKRIERELLDSDTIYRLYSDIDDATADYSHDTVREGGEIIDTSDMDEIANDFSFEGYDHRGDTFYKFLENADTKGWLNDSQAAELFNVVKSGNYNSLLKHLITEYNFTPTSVVENNMVRSFWVRNQTMNRVPGIQKRAWWYANIDENTLTRKARVLKSLIPKIGGSSRYGKDIRTNRMLPSTYSVSFVDYDNSTNKWELEDFQIERIYLKDMVDVFVGDNDESGSNYFSKPVYDNISGPLLRNFDRQFATFSSHLKWGKDNNGNPIIRTIVGLKAGGNKPAIIVARAPSEMVGMVSDANAILDYFDVEVERENLTEQQKKSFLDSIENEYSEQNKFPAVQHVLTHEFMKRTRGNKYLQRTESVQHHSRRLSIDFSEGAVPIGIGDRKVMILDQNKVFISKDNAKPVAWSDYLAGMEGKNRSDGAVWDDTEILDNIAESIGREQVSSNSIPLREVKTAIRYISNDDKFARDNFTPSQFRDSDYWEGEHYLAIKGNEFVVEPDLKILDSEDNIILYTSKEGRNVFIYDANDNRVNTFLTLDEAKEPDGGSGDFALKGRINTDVLTIPETSTRIIKVPQQRAKTSASFPWPWFSKLYTKPFESLRNTMSDRMVNVARANINAMFEARKNPNVLGALMGQMKSDNTSFIKEIDMLIEPKQGEMIEDGFMHPHIIRTILEPVKNKMIKENAYSGRRRGLGNYPVLKADLTGKMVRNKEGVVLSEDDNTSMSFLKRKLNVKDLNDINTALRDNPVYLLVGRWPVYASTGVFLGKIERVEASGNGNVVWYHPDKSFGELQADFDGDNSFIHMMYFGENYQDNTVVNEMLKPEVKKEFERQSGFVRVEYFEDIEDDYKYTSKKDIYVSGGRLGSGIGTQAMITNGITFFEDMNHRGFKAKIGDQTVVTKDLYEDSSLMSYAPLKDNITNEMLEKAGMGILADKNGNVWEEGSGKKYLMTSPIMELRILLQASVDNAKELKLSKWKFNGYHTLIPLMFKQENGSPIGTMQSTTIGTNLRKFFNYGDARKGIDTKSRRTLGISSMFETSKQIYDDLQLRPKERANKIKEKANTHRNMFKSRWKSTLPIKELTFNKNITPMEKLLSTPHEIMMEYIEKNPDDLVWEHPWGYDSNRTSNAMNQTRKDLMTIQSETARWYPESEIWDKRKEEARRFINNAADEFYDIGIKSDIFNDMSKNSLTAAGYAYNDAILDWIHKWYYVGSPRKKIKPFKDLTKDQQAYTTLRFLRGTTRQKKQIVKSLGKQSEYYNNRIIHIRDKLAQPGLDEKTRQNYQKAIKSLEDKVMDLSTTTSVDYSRIRNIDQILPIQLMDKDVWTEFINRYGPNLREASSNPSYRKMHPTEELRNKKKIEKILGKCGK